MDSDLEPVDPEEAEKEAARASIRRVVSDARRVFSWNEIVHVIADIPLEETGFQRKGLIPPK